MINLTFIKNVKKKNTSSHFLNKYFMSKRSLIYFLFKDEFNMYKLIITLS